MFLFWAMNKIIDFHSSNLLVCTHIASWKMKKKEKKKNNIIFDIFTGYKQDQISGLFIDTKTDVKAEIMERHIFKILKLLKAQN